MASLGTRKTNMEMKKGRHGRKVRNHEENGRIYGKKEVKGKRRLTRWLGWA